MLSLYLFSLLVGGALLAVSAFGTHHGGGLDASGHDLDGGHGNGDNPFRFLSLRNLTYFLFVFGGVGSLLSWIWRGSAGSVATLLLSLAAGIGTAAMVGATFRYLSKTESGARDPESSFVGLPGRVVLPIAAGGMGKVVVHRGDRVYELLAKPLDTESADATAWTSVIVVEMRDGTALVAPLDDATVEEESS